MMFDQRSVNQGEVDSCTFAILGVIEVNLKHSVLLALDFEEEWFEEVDVVLYFEQVVAIG